MGRHVKHQVAPLIRGAFISALEIVGDRRRQTLPEMVAQEIEDKGFLTVLQAISRFTEKESNVSVETHTESLADILTRINEAEQESVHH